MAKSIIDPAVAATLKAEIREARERDILLPDRLAVLERAVTLVLDALGAR